MTAEVESLMSSFENCPNDIEDLQLMRKALRICHNTYSQLNDKRLSGSEFESLARQCEAEAQSALGEDEPPWSAEDAIQSLVKITSRQRKEASKAWIESIQEEAISVATMSAADANRLRARADNPPPVITEAHTKRLAEIVYDIESRLNSLKIDWLVEIFKELSPTMRKEFLSRISEGFGA